MGPPQRGTNLLQGPKKEKAVLFSPWQAAKNVDSFKRDGQKNVGVGGLSLRSNAFSDCLYLWFHLTEVPISYLNSWHFNFNLRGRKRYKNIVTSIREFQGPPEGICSQDHILNMEKLIF
jgi:hypothetical protein